MRYAGSKIRRIEANECLTGSKERRSAFGSQPIAGSGARLSPALRVLFAAGGRKFELGVLNYPEGGGVRTVGLPARPARHSMRHYASLSAMLTSFHLATKHETHIRHASEI